ncbi:tetratricopeptide repeat protein [Anderseniella sp. Alg231-50]|uniref:tetratricopeptide repeat protein n=1 Tax=Anderseniella sp. Alg231-50 TaxID=1922226 RepID=UPI00307BE720
MTMRQQLTAAACTAALLLTGCAGDNKLSSEAADPVVTGSAAPQPSIRATAEAANAWREKPHSVRRAVTYARLLDASGNKTAVIKVLETTLTHNPDDAKLVAYLGKELVLSGRPKAGIKQLNKAIGAGENNWKVYSALGSAYDQTGKHSQARAAYQSALAQQPKKVSIHNNIGMSYILEGNLRQAETSLRAAQRLPEGEFNQTLRQNLALSVGLQGRFKEASEIASRDLPPEQVEQNLAFLKRMLNQRNTWQQMKAAS